MSTEGATESSRSAQCCRSLRRPNYAHKAMQADPTLRSVRAQRDELLKPEIRRVWMQNFQVYGAKKV